MLTSRDWKREDKLGELEGFRHGLRGDRPDQNGNRHETERAAEVGGKPDLDRDNDLCRER